jgi:hypothetical protein
MFAANVAPIVDVEENAAIVNAPAPPRPPGRAEEPGRRVRIVDGESGLLISDPHDLRAFGAAIVELLADPDTAAWIGRAARGECAIGSSDPDRCAPTWS